MALTEIESVVALEIVFMCNNVGVWCNKDMKRNAFEIIKNTTDKKRKTHVIIKKKIITNVTVYCFYYVPVCLIYFKHNYFQGWIYPT